MKYSLFMDRVRVEHISHALRENPQHAVDHVERAYHQNIARICDHVIQKQKSVILLTGPSASGKTTTAKKIAYELEERGKKVNRISLDNFYKSVDELPRWEDGYQNYESVDGLDIACFEESMLRLLREGHSEFPIFDFPTGRRSAKTYELFFDPETYLIVEGIHALNPKLSDTLQDFPCTKIYISLHSDFVDHKNRILLSNRELRLIRRILRDYFYRGTSPEATLKMWDYVLRGEDLYIRPYRRLADIYINSTHDYEPFLYRDELIHILNATDPNSPFHEDMADLQECMENFFQIDSDLIPKTSLIQEFIEPSLWKASLLRDPL